MPILLTIKGKLQMEKDLTLTHVKVLFKELKDKKGFGRSITIDCTEPDVKLLIEKWAEANGYNAKIKDYTNKEGVTTQQITFKISDYTRFGGKDGATENDLGWGAIVNLIVHPYDYNNNFGSGRSASISDVFIVEKAKSKMNSISE